MKDIHIQKKFFVALLIFAVAMVTLGFTLFKSNTNEELTANIISEQYCRFMKNGHAKDNVHIIKFEFDGHSYIKFGCGQDQTIVHDPNCKCQNNK